MSCLFLLGQGCVSEGEREKSRESQGAREPGREGSGTVW
eukprot:COSAG06_NODE_237_length_19433_cov_92.613961_14_plen_39_part_00